jgi:ribokinase
MAKILCIGSLNIDFVYQVARFVKPGETLSAKTFHKHPGGKGLNQSIAAARAGAQVTHIGCIGPEGAFLSDLLQADGVDTTELQTSDTPTGHAIIQVDESGENCILLFPGANTALDLQKVRISIESADPDTLILLQNEISGLPEILKLAAEKGLRTVFNPAPMTEDVATYPLDRLSVLICNESEGAALSGQTEPGNILKCLTERYPNTDVILTLGSKGCRCLGPEQDWHITAEKVKPIDTTAAGDTFAGYLVAMIAKGLPLKQAAEHASKAAAVTVARPGAAVSIPYLKELN